MKNGKYEAALMTLIPAGAKEWSADHIDLLDAAGNIDNLTDTIVRDAALLAKRFASFSEEMATRGDGWSPMGYSTLRDLEVNIAKLEVHKTYFRTLLRGLGGAKLLSAFNEALTGEPSAAQA
jgi:hypothetical protein